MNGEESKMASERFSGEQGSGPGLLKAVLDLLLDLKFWQAALALAAAIRRAAGSAAAGGPDSRGSGGPGEPAEPHRADGRQGER